jgi:hypothetical protein
MGMIHTKQFTSLKMANLHPFHMMQFCYFPEFCLPICITSVDFVLVLRCFSLFAAVCIVESVGRVHKAVFDAITNIHGIFESIHVAKYYRR